MVRVVLLATMLAMMCVSAHAADQPIYQPAAAWVRPVPIPFNMKSSGGAVDVLLWTVQDRLAPGDDESFIEVASRVNAPEGLGQVGNLIQAWNPLTESLTIHRARIIRGAQIIDLLADRRRFTVLRRETSLEAAIVDGELTATLQPEGLQVGDVLDFAFTLTRCEPALAGHSEGGAQVGHAGTIGTLSVHASWPVEMPFRTWKTDDLPVLDRTTHDRWTEVGFDQTGAISPDPPKGAPPFDRMFGLLSVGDFKDWADVSKTVYPLYAKAATLAPASPLKAEITRIRGAHSDPKSRVLAALEFVETQTRYLDVELDADGYTPAAADLTWTRRFGDCKGKAVLLLALLQGLGIDAEPALVNTMDGDGLDRRLPQMSMFDHVIVRAEIEGRTYWLDGTRMGDENLDVLAIPNYHWALPLQSGGAGLEALIPKDPVLPLAESTLHVDARNGIDKPARVHEELVMRGDVALGLSLGIRQESRTDADRTLRLMMTAARSWIKPDKVEFTYDPQRMEARATLEGSGTPPLTSSDGSTTGVRDWPLEGSLVGRNIDLTRPSDYHREAPYAVDYPAYTRSLIVVDLPDSGKDFEVLGGESVNRTVGGIAYSRAAAIANGRFNGVGSRRAVAPTFPAADAVSAEAELRSLADYGVSLRYTPPAAAAAAASAAVPSQSSSPADTATSKFLAKDYPGAEAAFTVALNAHPSAKLYYDRAAARAAMGKDALAETDLNAALKLDPKHAYALFALGRLNLARDDRAQAASRFAAAEAASDKPDSMAAMIAGAYETASRYAEAFPYWDRVSVDATSPDAKARALNAACWTRAEAGLEAQRALQDCDESLRLLPTAANTLDSRGLVDLRLGDFAKALADYSAALAKRPDRPTSLFGRALAERRLGQTAKADADVAAAHAIDPKIETTFAGWGLSR